MTICWWLVLKVKRALFSACPTFYGKKSDKNDVFQKKDVTLHSV